MNIPKIFGNRIVLIVVALALILIVIISLINTGNLASTGFASKDSKKNKQTLPSPPLINETDLENMYDINSGSPFVINIIPSDSNLENQTSNYTNTSYTPQQNKRRGGGGGHGGGGTGNNPPYYNNSNNQTNNGQGFQNFLKKRLSFGKLKNNAHMRWGGKDIMDGEEFQDRIRFSLDNKYNETIATFDINFTEINSTDVNLSDIVADSDKNSGKAFMHTASGILENIDLYVPKNNGDIAVIVCSGASNYNEIYYGCSNNSDVTKEEILYLDNPRVEISSDGLYFIVHNITGTGATGANVSELGSNRQNATAPGHLEAMAGNITEILLPGGSGATQSWAGYFGNVSGVIQIADGSDNVMYNWSLFSPKGEIFASTNNSVIWNYIQCFNFTSSGTYTDDTGNAGETSQYGTNITELETQYGIEPDDLDGVDETFYLKGPNTHNIFYINYNQFDEGECYNTRVYGPFGEGEDNKFEEVLLYEPTTASVVFAAILNEDLPGFDKNPHDFEMLVLENGHGTDTSTTMYYFYVAIS